MSSTNMEMSAASSSGGDAMPKSAEQKACGYSQLSLGKRHLLVSDIPEAVSTLALASELLAKQFGETHAECAEAYFYYGKSLLEMSRLEKRRAWMAMILRKVVNRRMRLWRKFLPSLLVSRWKLSQLRLLTKPMEGEEEEPSNLQHAWEMLELAKIIYTKQMESAEGDKKVELDRRVCETYLHLGEVSLENENYVQAVEDLTMCLSRRQASLPSDSRSIAETHYQLGVAQASCEKFGEAETSLESSISVLQTRTENLQKMESSENLNKEIQELQDLIKEIKEKCADHCDMKASASKKIKPSFSESGASDDTKAATTIEVKRKAEDVPMVAAAN